MVLPLHGSPCSKRLDPRGIGPPIIFSRCSNPARDVSYRFNTTTPPRRAKTPPITNGRYPKGEVTISTLIEVATLGPVFPKPSLRLLASTPTVQAPPGSKVETE